MNAETERRSGNLNQTGDQAEQRRTSRFDFDASLIARPKKNHSGGIRGRIIDLSCGGVRAVIAAELMVGDRLELEFRLPYTSSVVRPIAVVRSRKHFQYGLEFMLVVAADREKIDQVCVVLDLLR
jgi:hypothetical protein